MRFPIHIRDHGLALLLDWEAFLDYHAGHALAGAAIAWRAMEQAGILLSADEIWERCDLSVTARHAGPGVRDALEYVTRCFTRERFTGEAAAGTAGPCGSAADFRFTVSDGRRVVVLELNDGVVPESFFAAVRRCREATDSGDARAELSTQKAQLAEAVQRRDLAGLFGISVTDLAPVAGAAHA